MAEGNKFIASIYGEKNLFLPINAANKLSPAYRNEKKFNLAND